MIQRKVANAHYSEGRLSDFSDKEASSAFSEGSSSHLSNDVYQTLRGEILHGILRPNQALVEAEIAERLNVSRTPVRESMQILASEGLIVSRRRRWFVYEHTRGEIIQIYEIRAALESYAARLAATRATKEQLDALEGARPMATAVSLIGLERIRANEQFHDLIIGAANNPRLAGLIVANRLYAFNYSVEALYSTEHMATSSEQHAALIDAILARDPERAGDVAREHVEYSLNMIVKRGII
ncbi:hypothetical protein DEM27_30435 [Metarhizobium album]|uniref:HTH gntR-type domain-containing protein n=1 Tax=Metarhizobium album TaxID=2182425 RepID=A0A2U2DGP0_9HYPH|nr:GntR family transcriptional regulator [Rhizobium album]PWE52495.1 hypothetical protein DEM27_30435 [Rhizobium album]